LKNIENVKNGRKNALSRKNGFFLKYYFRKGKKIIFAASFIKISKAISNNNKIKQQ